MQDRAPEDILREEQENAGEKAFDEDAERAQQEADHRRDVEQDREMVDEDPEPYCRCNTQSHDPDCHIDHTLSALEAGIAFPGVKIGLGLPRLSEEAYGIKGILDYSYWNTNGVAMVIVAKEGTVADWAAYIGATNAANNSEEDTVRWVCRKGAKLSRDQAHRWFPDLPIEAYRE